MSNINITEDQVNEIKNKLKSYVVDFIYNFPTNQEIFQSDAEQIAKLRYYIEDLVKNCFIVLSDEWSIEILEYEFGIIPKPTDTLDIRRNRLLARKRGLGTTTPYRIKQICSTFVDNVNIIQHFEDYYFELQLENINKGFTNFLEDLIEIIEELKPAHLEALYELIETTKSNLYIGSATCDAEIITVYPWSPNNIEMTTNIYIPFQDSPMLENIVVYPKDNDSMIYTTDDNGHYVLLEFE